MNFADFDLFVAGPVVRELSWRVSLDADGDLAWDSSEDGRHVHASSEPDTSCSRRFTIWCLGWLPIESQL